MVDISEMVPNLRLDLRYASENNFVRKPMYPVNTSRTYLRLNAAKALAVAQLEFSKLGWGILVFDAYRPYDVTVAFWELIKDERYVANPSKGSGHNRGIAIDMSLYDLQTGKEIAMPTGFDNFSDSAHQDFQHLTGNVLEHRRILKETMERCGFHALETEWWHYYFEDDHRYSVLDLSFSELARANKKMADREPKKHP